MLQAALLSATDLRAKVLVRGNPGAVEVVARDASIAEVLSVLNATYGDIVARCPCSGGGYTRRFLG